MLNKKIILPLITIAILLSACGRQPVNMDELAEDDSYHYRNADLGFSLVLPSEFVYYQTQRTGDRSSDFIDLDIFVPTSDTAYPQAVPGYANPIKVRIFAVESWDEILEGMEDGTSYLKIGEKGGRVYTVKFWDGAPSDWSEKWNDDMKQEIIDGFKIE